MSLRFEQSRLRARLAHLDSQARAEFALDCAERLLPYYRRFHTVTGRGEPQVLASALRTVRAQLTGEHEPEDDLKALAERCANLVPRDDEPAWTILTGLAENAAAAVVYAIRAVASTSVDDALWTALQGYEAADLIATTALDADFNEPGIEERIADEDVVQRELAAQDESLMRLERNQPEAK